MEINEYAEYIEINKLFPKLNYGIYHQKLSNNYKNNITYRFDSKILLNKTFLDKCQYKLVLDYDETPNLDSDEDVVKLSPGYNYIDTNGNYVFEKTVVDYIIANNKELEINFAKYYKECDKSVSDLIIDNLGNVYTYFNKDDMIVDGDNVILYTNLPKDKYNEIITYDNSISYVINDDSWVCTVKNPNEVKELIKDFSHNGYKYPLCVEYIDGKYRSIACNCRLFAAKYLNLPSIPVCIIIPNQ